MGHLTRHTGAALAALAGLGAAPGPATAQAPGRGVMLEADFTADVFQSVHGGAARDAAYLDNLDLKLYLDGARLVGWPGALVFVYVLSNRGDNPSEFVGDAQGVSNIAAPRGWRLYEAWLQQNLLRGRLSLIGGLYDLNTEFDAIQAAGLLINSSFGIGADYGQSGQNGPSIFPVTSLGLRVKFKPHPGFYAELAVLDGVPGDPTDPGSTRVSLSRADGALVAAEVALLPGAAERPEALTNRVNARNRGRRIGRGQTAVRYDGKFALGSWLYTSRLDPLPTDTVATSPDRTRSFGVYVLAERTLFRERSENEGLTVFGRFGLARARVNRFGYYAGAGAVYAGLVPGRPDDEAGIGIAFAANGSPYRAALAAAGNPAERAEAAIEVTYRAQLLPWLAVQPDVQWIINPDTDPDRANALVIALRAELAARWR